MGIHRQTPAIHQHCNASTGHGLFQNVVVVSELRTNKQVNAKRAFTARFDQLLKTYQAFVHGIAATQ